MSIFKEQKVKIITAVASLFLLSACENGEEAGGDGEELITVRYTGFTGMNGLPVHYGIEQGIFEEHGLELDIVDAEDPVTAIASNEVDVAEASTTAALVAGGQDAPLSIVSSMYRSKGAFYLIGDPEVESIEALEGADVGINAHGIGMELYTREILSAYGVNEDEVTFVANGGHQDAYSSLINGQVDATIIHEPFASLSEIEDNAELLAIGWDYLPTFHTGVIAAHHSFIEEDPEVLEAFLAAYFESSRTAHENLEEYIEFVLERVEFDEEAVRAAFEREDEIWENDPNVDTDAIQDTQELQVEYGFQDEIYDADEIIDLRFIPEEE